MRHALLLAFVTLTAFAASQPDLVWAPGSERLAAFAAGETRIMIFASAECPSAAAFLRAQVKQLHDRIEQEHLPMRLVVITPDLSGAALSDWQKDIGIPQALVAQDRANARQISLNNILQVTTHRADGSETVLQSTFADFVETAIASTKGKPAAWHYPVSGLSPRGITLWWAVERGQPGAVAALVAAAKRKDADAIRLLAVVEPALIARQSALLTATSDLATYEALEGLIAEGGALESLKPSAERLKVVAREPTVKPELIAREAWRACQSQLASTKPKEQEAGKSNLAELARRYPGTVYGRRAAAK